MMIIGKCCCCYVAAAVTVAAAADNDLMKTLIDKDNDDHTDVHDNDYNNMVMI